jgi:hypothetical protein
MLGLLTPPLALHLLLGFATAGAADGARGELPRGPQQHFDGFTLEAVYTFQVA